MASPTATLTNDEKILHRHAVTLKNMLEDYHACEPRDEEAWRTRFKRLMVYLGLYDPADKLSSVYFRENQQTILQKSLGDTLHILVFTRCCAAFSRHSASLPLPQT